MLTVKCAVQLLESRKTKNEEYSLSKEERIAIQQLVYLLNQNLAYSSETINNISQKLLYFWKVSSLKSPILGSNSQESKTSFLLLEKFAQVVELVFGDLDIIRRSIDVDVSLQDFPFLKPGIHLITTGSKTELYTQILAIYSHAGRLPERRNLFLCRPSTTLNEVLLILYRWRNVHQKSQIHSATKHLGLTDGEENGLFDVKQIELFCLANVDTLSFEIQVAIVDVLQSIPNGNLIHPLVLLCGPSKSSFLIFQFANR
jgi:hypothetical protein